MDKFFFDFETFLFYPGLLAPPIVCMSYAYNDDAPEILHANFDETRFDKMLFDNIRNPNLEMIAFNGASMEWVSMLAHRSGWTPFLFEQLRKGRLKDPWLREKLARIAKGDHREVRNLAATLDDHFIKHTVDKGSKWRLRYGELWPVPLKDWPQEAIDYSLGDIAVRDLDRTQCERFKPEWYCDESSQVRASASLSLTSAWGFPVDKVAADQLYVETKETLEQYKQELLAKKLVRVEWEKGHMKFVRTKAEAEAVLIDAYAAMQRDPPRGDLTATMLKKAYKASGLQPPAYGSKDDIGDKEIQIALEDGVAPEMLVGNLSLNEEACLNSRSPLLLAYTRYGQASTLLSKVLRLGRAANAGKAIQASYNPLVNTGRTSCRQGEDAEPGEAWMAFGMQTQNLPRAGEEFEDEDGKKQTRWGAREAFVAPGYTDWLHANPEWAKMMKLCANQPPLLPDECIVSVDFDAFEMRTWAQCNINIPEIGFSDLAEILNDVRRCPHIEMGTMLREMHVESSDWQVRYAWGYGLKKTDKKELKKVRGLAKGPNFGLPGGMGWERLMDYCRLNYGVELTPEQAKKACQVWREFYREAQAYLDYIKNNVLKSNKRGSKGTITQFVSGRMRGGVGFCDASNGYFQGLAADAAKAAGWALMEEAYERIGSPFYGSRPLAFVHDEWLFAVKRARLHEAAHRMRDVQLAAAQRYCPDVLLTAAPAAMYRWQKAAGDPCFNSAGELIPYEESL